MSSFSSRSSSSSTDSQRSNEMTTTNSQRGFEPSLATVLASSPPTYCATCSRQATVVPGSTHEALGQIKWLPFQNRMPRGSTFFRQSVINGDPWNHPALVAAESTCGHLFFCLQMNSFKGTMLQDKFAPCRPEKRAEILAEYVPTKHGNNVSKLHGHEEAEIQGTPLSSQTYIHLEFGYWVELENLLHKSRSSVGETTLARINIEYAKLESHRQIHGSRAVAAFARCTPSPPTSPSRSAAVAPATRKRFPSPPETTTMRPTRDTSNDSWRNAPRRDSCVPSPDKKAAMAGSWRRRDN